MNSVNELLLSPITVRLWHNEDFLVTQLGLWEDKEGTGNSHFLVDLWRATSPYDVFTVTQMHIKTDGFVTRYSYYFYFILPHYKLMPLLLNSCEFESITSSPSPNPTQILSPKCQIKYISFIVLPTEDWKPLNW